MPGGPQGRRGAFPEERLSLLGRSLQKRLHLRRFRFRAGSFLSFFFRLPLARAVPTMPRPEKRGLETMVVERVERRVHGNH